ncbi:MAG: hypothetical protein K6E67_10390 [Prevotella sp.]|nr:hypothetical protein [Prevotella sp.]
MTGKDVILVLSQDGVALASTKIRSQSIKTQCATIEKASSTQQEWAEVIGGRKSWSLTVRYLVLAGSQVMDVLKVGQMFDVTMKEDGSNVNMVSGTALLSGVDGEYSVGNLAQGTFTFTGNGALT